MRSIGRNVDCFACADDGFLSAKCCLDLSIQHDKCFFKVMAMWSRATAGRDVHVDDAKATFCIVSIYGNGVSISDKTDVGQLSFMIGIRQGQECD